MCVEPDSECASHHDSVHFFNISALYFQKWSEYGLFCAFWLLNMLRAAPACNFRHKFHRWSEHGVFCTPLVNFDLEVHVLRATTACLLFDISNFRSGPRMVCFAHFWLQHVLRVHFSDISISTSVLRMVCFVRFDFACASRQSRASLHFSSAQTAPHPPLRTPEKQSTAVARIRTRLRTLRSSWMGP